MKKISEQKIVTKPVTIADSYLSRSMRVNNYTNQTAMLDIIDNSFERDVAASNITISVECGMNERNQRRIINKIFVSDNGCGMTPETLEKALVIGCETGKGLDSFGCYGVGMKFASLSIGKIMKVYTKTKDSKVLSCACINLDVADRLHCAPFVEYETFKKNTNEYKWFIDKISEHCDKKQSSGTVVEISYLDGLRQRDKYAFEKNMMDEFRMTYAKLIENGVTKLYVSNNLVHPYYVIPQGSDMLKSNEFQYKGKTFKYKAYRVKDTVDKDNELGRTMKDQGFWVYRNNRLVGKALPLGVFDAKHPHRNAFRVELFIDGDEEVAKILGLSSGKYVCPQEKNEVDEGFRRELSNAVGSIMKQIDDEGEREMTEKTINNDEVVKVYDEIVKAQNRNKFIDINKKKIIVNHPGTYTAKNPRGKQKNPNPKKTFENSWLEVFKECHLGQYAGAVEITQENNKTSVIVNTDHPFYKEAFSKLSNSMKKKFGQIITCFDYAKQKAGYYYDDNAHQIIDEFLYNFQECIRISLSE